MHRFKYARGVAWEMERAFLSGSANSKSLTSVSLKQRKGNRMRQSFR